MKNDWLQMNCPPFPAFISCGKSFFRPGDVHSERIFPAYVLMFITQGTVHFQEGSTQYDLKAGEYFIQTPGIRHYGYKPSRENAEYYWIHFLPTGKSWVFCPENQNISMFVNKGITVTDIGYGIRKPELLLNFKMHDAFNISDFLNLLLELNHSFNVSQNQIKSQSLFTEIIGCLCENNALDNPCEKDFLVNKVYSYINENYRNNINLNKIASEFHFTPDYISRCFKQKFKITPNDYCKQLKMRYAKNMLTSTIKSIELIANELGCTDIAVFSRMFKKAEGVAPTQYRLRVWGISKQ